jgi:hypothetical protein
MNEIEEWFVAFGEFHKSWRWWHLFTRPGWRHVYAFATQRGAWVVVDPLSNRQAVVLLHGDDMDEIIRAHRAAGFPVLRMRREIHKRGFAQPLYCVSVVKHLLGLRSWAITPKQLHDAMIRRGAVPAFV